MRKVARMWDSWTEVSVQQLLTLVWLENVWPHDSSFLCQINCDSPCGFYEALEPICNTIVSNCKRLWYHCENVVSHLCTSVIWLVDKRLFHYLIAKVGFLVMPFCHVCVWNVELCDIFWAHRQAILFYQYSECFLYKERQVTRCGLQFRQFQKVQHLLVIYRMWRMLYCINLCLLLRSFVSECCMKWWNTIHNSFYP
jgi:hypothetical protein